MLDAKEVQKGQKALEAGEHPCSVLPKSRTMERIKAEFPDVNHSNIGIGSTILLLSLVTDLPVSRQHHVRKYLVVGQILLMSMQQRDIEVLINWGMLPFLIPEGDLPFKNGDYLFIPGIKKAIDEAKTEFDGICCKEDGLHLFKLSMDELTSDEREIILDGCLINYYKSHR